ncbi:MAG: ATP-binding protein [Oscillospiraceae bacterium]|nr:ATP-binding protein [Oscillospiraceae bacterium]
MSNPFSGNLIPYDYELGLLDRYGELDSLEDKCSGRTIQNYRYISPRGTGKTTLLEMFFTPEKCQDLARQHKLVCICRFSGEEMRTESAVLVRLIGAVKESLENLDPDSLDYQKLSAEIQRRQEKHPGYRTDPSLGNELLREILNLLKQRRYFVTLVLDEFHQLACAKHLEDSTFSKMANLSQDKLISYIVASDYDDDVGSETYYISPFSRIFGEDAIHLAGVTSRAGKRALIELIRSKLVRYPNVMLTDKELMTIIEITSGIPKLVQCTLKDIFRIKQELDEELTEDQIAQYALSAGIPLMEKWVQYFDDARWETMEAVLNEVTESRIKAKLTQNQDKHTSLCNAGLIDKNLWTQEYHAICPLFAEYVRQELSRRNPPEVSRESTEVPKEQTVINNFYHIQQGGTLVQNPGSGNVAVVQNHLHQGVSIPELLSLLGTTSSDSREMFASNLAERLKERIPAGSFPVLLKENYATEEEYEQAYDDAFAQYSQNMVEDVQVDEDQELMISPAEIQTLDSRFEQAHKRCRTDLEDTFLSRLSERCQFYIKLSVVVEDALELPGLQMDDYSPQLVLYGKALEQSLRDSFYPLFHKEKTLSAFSTRRGPGGEPFAARAPGDTTIGSYAHLISSQKSYLARLCRQHAIRIPDVSGDIGSLQTWWDVLQKDIHKARKIRNLADHADSVSPNRKSLNDMCALLFDSQNGRGILARNIVGEELTQQIFPPEICPDANRDLVGQTCTMKCTTVKKNGGIKGTTSSSKYPINVSHKRIEAFRKENGCERMELRGKELLVKILEFKKQDNVEFFAAEIIGIGS